MDFFDAITDAGSRKRFAYGCPAGTLDAEWATCPACGEERVTPDYDKLFEDKTWNLKMYMSRDYYADFAILTAPVRRIVSEKAKGILAENFDNAIDFSDIEMVSFRDFTSLEIKKMRDSIGSAALKKIPNDPPQYYRLLLKRQGADLDFKKSNIRLVLDCKRCGCRDYEIPNVKHVDGKLFYPKLSIIESTWKGYDIFHVEGYGNTVFCTERFVEVYKQAGLTGLIFEQMITV